MSSRSLTFGQHPHNRFWSHRTPVADCAPISCSFFSDAEWDLMQGGLTKLHDASRFAASFDSNAQGGVFRAVNDWSAANGRPSLMLNSFVEGGTPDDYPCPVGCDLAIVQKNRA